MNLLGIPILLYLRYFASEEETDQSFGLIDKLGVPALLQSKKWKDFEQKIAPLSSSELSKLIEGFRSEVHFSAIEDYIASNDSDLSKVIAGSHYTNIAWKIRSGARAKYVTDDQWSGFIDYLRKAYDCLPVNSSDPKMKLEALARRIRVNLGLSDKAEAYEDFNNCKEIDPDYLLAHLSMFKVVTPRWLGSKQESLEFAQSPQNPKLKTLLEAVYLVEVYDDLSSDEEHEEAEDLFLLSLFENENQAVLHSLFSNLEIPKGDSTIDIYTKNYLAYLYNILNAKKQRDELLKQLKGRITAGPWHYSGIMNERDLKLYKLGGLL